MKQFLLSTLMIMCMGCSIAFAQCDCKVNMSFERAEGGCFGQNCSCNCLPDNIDDSWEQCDKWGCGSTDIEPGGNLTIGNIAASNGKTFMSMTCGPNGEGNSIKLCAGAPLKKGTQYCFSIDLLTKGGNTVLAIYGSNSACDVTEPPLWKSKTVTAATWRTDTFCIIPTSDWAYLSFRVVEGSGAIGVDNLVSKDGKFPPQPDGSACGPKVVIRDTSVCANGCTQLVAIGSAGTPGYTYNWSTGATGDKINVCPGTTTQTYTVTLTDAAGKKATATGKINVNAAPAVTVNAAEICPGGSAKLTASGATNYVWSPSTGLNTTTGNTVTATPKTTTTYTVIGTNTSGCKDTATALVTVHPQPDVQATGGTICPGDSVKLNVTDANAAGGITYAWLPATNLSDPAIADPYAFPTATTTYTVTGSNAMGCKSTATATVTISNNLVPMVSADTGICIGASKQLKANGGSKYLWSPVTGLSNPAIANPVANPLITTTYEVTVSSGSCVGTKKVTITVNPLPTITATSAAICEKESATLTVSGANTYKWSSSTGASPNTGSPVTVQPLETTTYTIIGTDTKGCADTTITTVTVNPAPIITVNSATICNGISATLTASGGVSYTWQSSGGQIPPPNASVTLKPVTSTSYTVTGIGANGCKNTAIATITVNPIPDIGVNSGTICKGKNFTIKAVGASTSYSWVASDGTPLPATDQVIVSPVSNTSYTVTGTAKGCSDTAIAHVNVNPIPVITVNNAAVCARQEVTLTASGGSTYLWSTKATTPKIVVTPSISTSYTVTGTQAGCSNDAVAIVTVYGNPITSFYPNPRELSEDEPKVVFYNSSGGKNLVYAWTFGDDAGVINTSTKLNPSHLYSHPGTYTICLKATDSINGCVDSICKDIVYKPQWTIYVPNAFTPGHPEQDLNDIFYAYGTNILKFRMLIFDRWGNQIFESNDLYKGWDGRVKGKPELAQQDVYVWKIDCTDVFNKEHQYIGHVTLLK